MHYALSHRETPTESFRRLATEQLERAVSELESDSNETFDERVHAVRKRLKKLRAVLQLARGSLDRRVFEREDRAFRDAGRRLAAPRRAAAILGALEPLADELGSSIVEEIRSALLGERERALAELAEGDHASDVARTLEEARARIQRLELGVEGWEAYRRGFRRAFRRARRSFRRALREQTTDSLHAWRRWAKYHFYHVRLLGPVWPDLMQSVEKSLDDLTETLGAEHDLDDLRMLLIEGPMPSEESEALAPVLRAIDERRKKLRKEAFAIGNRLFTEHAKSATRRVGAYFETWQATPRPGSSTVSHPGQ